MLLSIRVCICERERESARERKKNISRHTFTHTLRKKSL